MNEMQVKKIEDFRKNIRMLKTILDFTEKRSADLDGITFSQFQVLSIIYEMQSCLLIDIAKNLVLDKSTVSRTIDGLVKIELVNRDVDPKCRRCSKLTLTEKGLRLVRKINDENNLLFDKVLSEIPQNEKVDFIKNFSVFTKSFFESTVG